MRLGRTAIASIRCLIVVVACHISGPGRAHGEASRARFQRSDRGWARDARRLATIPRIRSLTELLGTNSTFGGKLPMDGAQQDGHVAWSNSKEGPHPFAVPLGKGLRIVGVAHHYNLVRWTTTKLTELKLVNGDRSTDMMPKSKSPILFNFQSQSAGAFGKHDGPDASFSRSTQLQYDRTPPVIGWHGPESRYAIVALLHEIGHAKDLGKMAPAERETFTSIYDLKSDGKPMTAAQRNKMVAFERSAWAHALHKTRRLKQQGFDILAGVPTAELMKVIYGSMKGYYEYEGGAK